MSRLIICKVVWAARAVAEQDREWFCILFKMRAHSIRLRTTRVQHTFPFSIIARARALAGVDCWICIFAFHFVWVRSIRPSSHAFIPVSTAINWISVWHGFYDRSPAHLLRSLFSVQANSSCSLRLHVRTKYKLTRKQKIHIVKMMEYIIRNERLEMEYRHRQEKRKQTSHRIDQRPTNKEKHQRYKQTEDIYNTNWFNRTKSRRSATTRRDSHVCTGYVLRCETRTVCFVFFFFWLFIASHLSFTQFSRLVWDLPVEFVHG